MTLLLTLFLKKKFNTGQEYIDGMDARELLKITGQLLGFCYFWFMMQFILNRKKVTELLYHPHLSTRHNIEA